MTKFLLRLYDYLHARKGLCGVLLVSIVTVSAAMAMRLQFNEDIGDFLPDNDVYRKSMAVYQKLNAADRIFVVLQMKDTSQINTDRLTEAAAAFQKQADKQSWKITAQIDYDKLLNVASFVYRNAPLFLTDADFSRMEQLMTPDSIAAAMQRNKEMLLFPTGNLLSQNVERDPLGLFLPIAERLQTGNAAMKYELNDGYIFSPDGKRAIIMIDSPYGASETAKNTKLIERIDSIASVIGQSMTDVQILTTGAPVIAVQNAEQIKTDGLWTVSIAIILIVSLLFYSLRSWRHILLIVVAIAFGWLIALAGMSLIHRQVSIIVLGIASIIIGIAVNYPLHFVAHLSHRPSPRDTLRDLIEPLVIGNVTTVGAFCALIPLNSVALRDLGIFAAFMLVGTILFVTVFLPHLCHIRTKAKANGEECAEDADEYTPVYPRNKWIITAFVGVTLLLGYFSMSTAFDTNMQNINYLSADQRHLLADLAVMRNEQAGTTQVYMANEGTTPDRALEQSEADGADAFITSRREQQRRIDRWNAFLTRHQTLFRQTLPQEAARNGFSTDAFADFYSMLQTPFHPHDIRFFAPLINNGIGTRIIGNTAVHIKNIPNAEVPQLIDRYGNADGSRWAFDVKSMNSTIASSLSDNFNYIGWACGLIVFIFLWLSFGKIEHALIAFLPMAVSWIWILGTMHILGMSFNLVNIILATFIFGQGDDYSIFMTEGLLYEHTHHRRMLASYKRSIFLSATIMFIGMGTLVIARHPALSSLGEITIVGMATVVAMTYLLPPVVFGWLYTYKDGSPRPFPITVRRLVVTAFDAIVYLGQILYGLLLSIYLFKIRRKTPARTLTLHRQMYHLFRYDIHHIAGVKTTLLNPEKEDFAQPAIIICNHKSLLDPVCLMALSPRILIVTGTKVWHNPMVHRILCFADFISMDNGIDSIVEQCRKHVAQGYSIAIFPEGERVTGDDIGRFHNGAFLLAKLLHVDLLPVYLHGLKDLMPLHSPVCNSGRMTIQIGKRISPEEQQSMGDSLLDIKKTIHRQFTETYRETDVWLNP